MRGRLASATSTAVRIDVSGVRSSCDALAMKPRWLENASSSRSSMESKVSARSLSSSGGPPRETRSPRCSSEAQRVRHSEEVERRVDQASLLEAEERRVGAVLGAEATVAQPVKYGPAGILQAVGDADLGPEPAAALEDAEDVARLRDLITRKRIEIGDDAVILAARPPSAGGTVCRRWGTPLLL